MSQAKKKSSLSPTVLDKLWNTCIWAHEVWVLRRALIDENRHKRKLARGHHVEFLRITGEVLHDYVLLQIAKLHDHAVVSGRICLTIEYIMEYGGWDPAAYRQLQELRERLDVLDKKIRSARNRIISHNDLAAILADEPLGAFDAGADKRYFRTLQRFVKLVYLKATGEPCADFSVFPRGDATAALNAFLASDAARRG